tara:strand:- start:219 stop:845 length:627 start_codon:yes stop_codon:yes gene_type:complete
MAKLLKEDLPKVIIEPTVHKGTIDPFALFSPPPLETWLEIGFGAGEHMAWQAKNNPNIGIIGCEPFINGIASLLRHSSDQQLSNIRILADDARPFLPKIPDECISRLFILFPDPWPKKKHQDRRIIQNSVLTEFHRILKPGGKLRVATDHQFYLRWILIHFNNHSGFLWTAQTPKDWRSRAIDWPQTRYELKALSAGRKPIFLEYKKV